MHGDGGSAVSDVLPGAGRSGRHSAENYAVYSLTTDGSTGMPGPEVVETVIFLR